MLTGCATTITIRANADKSAGIEFGMGSFGDAISNVFQNAGGLGMMADGFSDSQIKDALSQGDFSDVSVTSNSDGLNITGLIPAPERQSAVSKDGSLKISNFVMCTEHSLAVVLSPETIGRVMDSLPEDVRTVTDLFMAPVFTGDVMSGAEYRNLIASVYGDDIARELDSSVLRITLEAPKGMTIKETSLSGTTRSVPVEKKAVLSIPLVEFLTLSSPRTFSITY